MERSRAQETLARLRRWVEATGWAGHDPFDVRSHPLYLRLSARATRGGPIERLLLGLLYRFEQRHPRAVRRLLRTEPRPNAKGMGLFARGYAMLATAGDEAAAGEKSRRLDWLRAHTTEGYPGVSWGYPFDWQSHVFIPRGTPSSVVTGTVADAFRHEFTHRGTDAELLQGVATFLCTALDRHTDGERVCLSYTPIDRMRVHNANVIAGEFLTWAGVTFDDASWRNLGRQALAYTVQDQEPSGAWDYWGPPDRGRRPRTVDPYHTGFVLRMLLRAHAWTGDETYLHAATRGHAFLVSSLLDGVVPRATEARSHPVNGHAVAEILLVSKAFERLDADAAGRAEELLDWALRHMWDPAGYFHYLWWPERANTLPMMRWVEAWMFLALAAMLGDEPHP